MKEKPCPRCNGDVLTWGNVDDFRICDKHQKEIMDSLMDWSAEKVRADLNDLLRKG